MTGRPIVLLLEGMHLTCSGTGSGRWDIIWWKSAKVKDLSCNQYEQNYVDFWIVIYKHVISFVETFKRETVKSPECGTSWLETSMGEGQSHKVSVKSKFITIFFVCFTKLVQI